MSIESIVPSSFIIEPSSGFNDEIQQIGTDDPTDEQPGTEPSACVCPQTMSCQC